MSKNKKAIKVKPGKANKVNKPIKKASKPLAKKPIAKKTSTPAAKKPTKGAASKPATKSSPVKKNLKTNVKSKPHNAPKKATPAKKVTAKAVAKSSKPVKKAAPVKKLKVVAKPVGKAPSKKEVKASKPVPPKKTDVKKQVPVNKEPKVIAKPVPAPKAPEPEKVKRTEETTTKKQAAEKRSQDVLAITNTIPVKEKPVISASRIASISHSITNPVKRLDSYSIRPEKEPAGKFELEFVVHASADMLYEFLSTPSGLSEWFCDDLNIRNGIYTFIWEDTMQQARLLKTVELQLVRFQWVDKTDGSYFEFRIQRDDLTNDISLIITDFADSHGDRESSKLLWHSQIEKLMHVIGSIF